MGLIDILCISISLFAGPQRPSSRFGQRSTQCHRCTAKRLPLSVFWAVQGDTARLYLYAEPPLPVGMCWEGLSSAIFVVRHAREDDSSGVVGRTL